MGFSGRIAAIFYRSQLTPLLALVGLLMGLFAGVITPREEEPQIDVTMANVFVPFYGANVANVESQVSIPMEKLLSEIEQVEHVYSVSRPGMAVFTVQFDVGVPRTEALVKLYNAIYANQDWRPANMGIGQPMVKPKSIDDVSVVNLTLWSKDNNKAAYDLGKIAHALEAELQHIKGTRTIETIGSPNKTVNVVLDAQRLAASHLSFADIRAALMMSNQAVQAGAVINSEKIPVQAGEFMMDQDELKYLVVGVNNNKPVYLQDIAHIETGAPENSQYVWYQEKGDHHIYPAVTLAIGKKPGKNAVDIANHVMATVNQLKGTIIPNDVSVSITRNYGETANEKANTLIKKLIFATASVVLLVFFVLGWREAVVVGSAVILTLLITLFASWAWGFTLNRVSLFALIFSIGILVDDAIVVVENIHRHMNLPGATLVKAIPMAVDEVGGPTILATFTVIAALLPMAFVTGLMGPYMSPIPINASMGMFISLVVAFTFTPWLAYKLLPKEWVHHEDDKSKQRLNQFFTKVMTPFLGAAKRKNRYILGGTLVALIFVAMAMVGMKWVVLKMLPFDNKSEFQVVLDMPEGTTLETTNHVLIKMAAYLSSIDEVANIQAYVGTASPIGFNGLVRQYYLRNEAHQGELQVNLLDKHHRHRSSHDIARSVRAGLVDIAKPYHANIKVVEVPPGPPVMSPVVAEVYGSNYESQINTAEALKNIFADADGLVDIDTSIEAKAPRYVLTINQSKAAMLGVSAMDITHTLAAVLSGDDVSYLHDGSAKYPVPLRLILSPEDKSDIQQVLAVKIKSSTGAMIALADIVNVKEAVIEHSIYHKDLLPVVYVTADMAGALDSPLYGMFEIINKIANKWPQTFITQPENTLQNTIKWDGEWQITYETFRDMGAAYSVGLLLIFLLVVAQFKSYAVPLVIMAPIAFTLIGIMPGHALLGAQFTATSMIGMIALAGIIVRNSILLVDFMNQRIAEGVVLEQAVIEAAAVRAKPIVLTAIAAMMGGFFIVDDPIFNGLAVSLIFGLLVSTVLTLVVIPLLYYSLLRRQAAKR